MQIVHEMNEHRRRLLAGAAVALVLALGVLAIAYYASDRGHDHAASGGDAGAFWSAVEPGAAEVFYPESFDELAGGAEFWVIGDVVDATIAVPEPRSIIVIRPTKTIGGDPLPTDAPLAVKFGDLTWTPIAEQIRDLEAQAPIGATHLLGVTRLGAGPGAAVRLATSRAAFGIEDGKLVPLLDREVNSEWLAKQGVESADEAVARIEASRAACNAAGTCIIGFTADGQPIRGSWPASGASAG